MLVIHLFLVDGEIGHAFVSCHVVVYMDGTQTMTFVVEDTYQVTRVGDDVILNLYASHDVHRILRTVDIRLPLGLFALHFYVDGERLSQSVFICQVDDVVVFTHIDILADAEGYLALLLCCNHIGGNIYG